MTLSSRGLVALGQYGTVNCQLANTFHIVIRTGMWKVKSATDFGQDIGIVARNSQAQTSQNQVETALASGHSTNIADTT